jgi:hypothetical protein
VSGSKNYTFSQQQRKLAVIVVLEVQIVLMPKSTVLGLQGREQIVPGSQIAAGS